MKNLSSPIDLIKKSFGVFFEKENLIYFLKIYSLLIPVFILRIIEGFFIVSNTKNLINYYDWTALAAQHSSFLSFVIITDLLFAVISMFVSLAGIIAVDSVVSGSRLSVKDIFAKSWKLFGSFAVLSFLLGIVVGFGFVLLIIPGLLFIVWYRFANFELVLEGAGIMKSFGLSKALVRGRFWAVLGRIIVFGIFGMLVSAAFSVVPFGIGQSLSTLFGALILLPTYYLYRELKN